MPTTNSPTEVRTLIADWLKLTKERTSTNPSYEPSDLDLKEFLISKGYDSNAVEQMVSKLPEKEKSDDKKEQQKSSIDKLKRQKDPEEKPKKKDIKPGGVSKVSKSTVKSNISQTGKGKKQDSQVSLLKKKIRLLNKKELLALKRELVNGT